MPLRLITGRANSGKTGEAYGAVREALARRERVRLILPSAPDVARAAVEFSENASLGLSISTFSGAIGELWAHAGDGRGVAGAVHRELALRAIARRAGSSAQLARLASQCVAVLAEETGTKWREQSPVGEGAARDLARLISEYANHLEACGAVELDEAGHLLAVAKAPYADLIVVHRFDDFTQVQHALMRSWARAADVIVTATWDPTVAATRHTKSLMDNLCSNMQDICTEHHLDASEVADASRALFSPSEGGALTGEVRLCLADGAYAEAIGVAAEAGAALNEGAATSPERVAVVCRDLAAHAEGIRSAFEEAGIPAQIDTHRAFGAAGLGAALLDAIEFSRVGARSHLLRLLRSGYVSMDQERARSLEARWRRQGTRDPRALVRALREEHPGLAARLDRISKASAKPLRERECGDLLDLAGDLLRARWGQAQWDEIDTWDTRAHQVLSNVLNEVAASEVEVLLDDVTGQLASSNVSAEPTEVAGYVQVMPVGRVRGRRFDTVILAGLNLGEFPAGPNELMTPGGAVDDVLTSFGVRRRARKGSDYERLMFYETLSRARRRVVLSAQRTDTEGETRPLSPFYEEVAEVLGSAGAPHVADRYTTGHEALGMPGFSRSRQRQAAAAHQCGDARVAAAVRRVAHRAGSRAVQLTSERPLSPSQIESYLACPYRWFHERALNPRILEADYGPRDEGDFAHALLAATYRALIDGGLTPLTQRNLEPALQVFEECLTEVTGSTPPPCSLAEEIGRRRAAGWVRRIMAEDAGRADGFRPQFIEWSFGADDEPVELGGFAIAGRLDRLDVDGQGRAVVVDYKRSCGSKHGAQKMLADGKVQMPLYIAVVKERLGLEVVGGLYRGLSMPSERGLLLAGALDEPRATRTDRLDPEQFTGLVEEALDLAREAAAGIREGQIPTKPLSDDSCVGCPVGATCGARR